mmetsp:Transcript_14407/g.18875  ORF Transcript_14407/g.18875 Transcript_14407/m.18875 type:complete len:835 (-) Transcript_14407:206-2710(-)
MSYSDGEKEVHRSFTWMKQNSKDDGDDMSSSSNNDDQPTILLNKDIWPIKTMGQEEEIQLKGGPQKSKEQVGGRVPCPTCKKLFGVRNLSIHRRRCAALAPGTNREEAGKSRVLSTCEICKRTFESIQLLISHKNTCNVMDPQKILCSSDSESVSDLGSTYENSQDSFKEDGDTKMYQKPQQKESNMKIEHENEGKEDNGSSKTTFELDNQPIKLGVTRIKKLWGKDLCWGTVKSYDPDGPWYQIIYDDGDEEDMTPKEVFKLKVPEEKEPAPAPKRARTIMPMKGGASAKTLVTIASNPPDPVLAKQQEDLRASNKEQAVIMLCDPWASDDFETSELRAPTLLGLAPSQENQRQDTPVQIQNTPQVCAPLEAPKLPTSPVPSLEEEAKDAPFQNQGASKVCDLLNATELTMEEKQELIYSISEDIPDDCKPEMKDYLEGLCSLNEDAEFMNQVEEVIENAYKGQSTSDEEIDICIEDLPIPTLRQLQHIVSRVRRNRKLPHLKYYMKSKRNEAKQVEASIAADLEREDSDVEIIAENKAMEIQIQPKEANTGALEIRQSVVETSKGMESEAEQLNNQIKKTEAAVAAALKKEDSDVEVIAKNKAMVIESLVKEANTGKKSEASKQLGNQAKQAEAVVAATLEEEDSDLEITEVGKAMEMASQVKGTEVGALEMQKSGVMKAKDDSQTVSTQDIDKEVHDSAQAGGAQISQEQQSIEQFMKELHFEQYIRHFKEIGVDTKEDITDYLEDADWCKLSKLMKIVHWRKLRDKFGLGRQIEGHITGQKSCCASDSDSEELQTDKEDSAFVNDQNTSTCIPLTQLPSSLKEKVHLFFP